MKSTTTVIFMLGITCFLSACGTVPKSRMHFIELMKEESGVGPWKRMAFSKTIEKPFQKAFDNINDKLLGCVPGGYQTVTMRGSSMSSQSVNNNSRIEKVGSDKAEITIQQYHSGTVMQSDGGFYLLAVDMARVGEQSVRLDFFVGKHYLGLAEAVEHWANGSEKCHGIGGNP
ncbi:MAG: hypothetical protein HWD86_03875 [Kangiellaceae bacterium]|nr:hypothetical protein [Kangiellaceae bacterium]